MAAESVKRMILRLGARQRMYVAPIQLTAFGGYTIEHRALLESAVAIVH